MDPRSADRVRRSTAEAGFTTVQYVVTVGLSLVLLVMVANVLVDLYARGAIRDALDEGVRAGAPAGAGPRDCETRAREVLDGLLRGPIGDDVHMRCEVDGSAVVARAQGTLPSWLPMVVPPWRFQFEASMRGEP
jgi:hypothetical protein